MNKVKTPWNVKHNTSLLKPIRTALQGGIALEAATPFIIICNNNNSAFCLRLRNLVSLPHKIICKTIVLCTGILFLD
jgi:hypothetical protein